MYSEEMTRVVLVPTWDEGGKYYMGRTKVGIDELSVMATTFSNNVASNEKEKGIFEISSNCNDVGYISIFKPVSFGCRTVKGFSWRD